MNAEAVANLVMWAEERRQALTSFLAILESERGRLGPGGSSSILETEAAIRELSLLLDRIGRAETPAERDPIPVRLAV
ncbi:MAG: hypothetical protein ACOYOJ_07855 [Alsobacter sp.]